MPNVVILKKLICKGRYNTSKSHSETIVSGGKENGAV